jgi:hypothetical protein
MDKATKALYMLSVKCLEGSSFLLSIEISTETFVYD